jgi:capsular exopolysaccharide synthesis family protein
MQVLALRPERWKQTLLVTSPSPNEGKSSVAVNLGASLARTGLRVVVVDADLRLPSLHETAGVAAGQGLSEVLQGEVSLDHAVIETSVSGLHVLTSGARVMSPAELLGGKPMREVVARLQHDFDVVIFDSPAMLGLADALTLARLTSGVIFVVRRSETLWAELSASLTQLDGIKIEPLGVVFNGASRQARGSRYRRLAAA